MHLTQWIERDVIDLVTEGERERERECVFWLRDKERERPKINLMKHFLLSKKFDRD